MLGKKGRVFLGASHSAIENLGLIYLLGVARDEGWERGVSLVKNHDFEPFFDRVRDFKPDVIGFNIYTGCHLQLFEAFDRLRRDHPNTRLVIGGPHATYFPDEAAQHADNAVMSEGFNAFRRILRDEVGSGIIEFNSANMELFPHPDRETFYRDSPEHASSPIKSVIRETGCPFDCSYCYNSTKRNVIAVPSALIAKGGSLSLALLDEPKESERLFPRNIRTTDAVIAECQELAERWPTKLVYFQDDVFGFRIEKFRRDGEKQEGSLEELAERWPGEVGIPFHAQMRWEMTDKDGEQRLDLTRQAGASGLTLAIEAADATIRKEVLDRNMPEDVIFQGMRRLVERGLTVRTEQITALPYGATSKPTKINLAADLELLEFNVRLRQETGGPTMAWASTLAPYNKTNIGLYSRILGYYRSDNSDVPDEFFERSVLRFFRQWVGDMPEVRSFQAKWKDKKARDPTAIKDLDLGDVWLSEGEQERYRTQNAELRRHFNTFALLPEGHRAATVYLEDTSKFGYARLGEVIESHLTDLSHAGNPMALDMVAKISSLRASNFSLNDSPQDHQAKQELRVLSPYLAVLPHPEQTARRAVRYSLERPSCNGAVITPKALSTAVRHELYESSLYKVEDPARTSDRERYPAKT